VPQKPLLGWSLQATVFCGFQRCVWGIPDRSKSFCLWGTICAIVAAMIRRIAIYARCSTDEQTTENQIRELRAVASRHGWDVAAVFDDNGVSGGAPREDRPAMTALLRAVARREVDMVAAWAVDRLGRSLIDLLGFLGELHAKKIDLYLHQQGLDTSTPAGRAMFQMLGVFAEFERSMIRERVKAGMARARVSGTKTGAAIGRPAVAGRTQEEARALLRAGHSEREVARLLGIGKGTIHRLRTSIATALNQRPQANSGASAAHRATRPSAMPATVR
jgi:DNA invertase Pin-like site-specific DNA recombinase